MIEGMQTTAYAARSGQRLWSLTLAATGEVRQVRVSADGKTSAVLTSAAGGRVFVLHDGRVVATLPTGGNELAVSADGLRVAVAVGDQLKLYSAADGLRWVLPADDTLHSPRFSSNGNRLAVASELGTLSVVDQTGNVLLERDTGTIAVPAWLPDGDLLVATWADTSRGSARSSRNAGAQASSRQPPTCAMCSWRTITRRRPSSPAGAMPKRHRHP